MEIVRNLMILVAFTTLLESKNVVVLSNAEIVLIINIKQEKLHWFLFSANYALAYEQLVSN